MTTDPAPAEDRPPAQPDAGACAQLPPEQARAVARTALLATAALYLSYAGLRQIPWPPVIAESLGVLLIAGFYFLPTVLLRRHPELARCWQVGPDSPIPPWRASGWRWALLAAVAIFPLFAVGTWLFYWRVCQGDLSVLTPVLWVEGLTPAAGGLERFLFGLCLRHDGGLWPTALVLPPEWTKLWGLGFVQVVAVGLFAVALPEEVFHRGYLLGALEQRWPPTRKLFGVPFGWAAVLSSALFALGHLVSMANTARLATFFPALVFVWLWRRSGSLWAPALFHVASNLLMDLLLASTFAPR